MKKYTLKFNDDELDIIVTLLDLCARSNQIFANDPKNPLDGLHIFERTPEERLLAKQIVQRIARELL